MAHEDRPLEPEREPARESERDDALRARVREAFSIRRNLRLLFVPSSDRLRPLDGLRAFSILWVIVFHTAWYCGLLLPPPLYFELLLSRWMLPVWRGDFGVDVFFVLSGFLIAGMLVDERERTGRIGLIRFYGRRLARLWPALCLTVALEVALIGDHADMVWANLLYVSNFLSVVDAAMAWTWSLAIEEQFYLVCPWLVGGIASLRKSTSIAVILGIAAALCGLGAWIVVSGGFHAFDSEIVVNRDLRRWALGYDHLYSKPWMRAGALLMGVGAAYLYRIPRVMEALARRRITATVGLVIALALAVACTHWPIVEHASRRVEVAFMATYRTIFGAAVAYILLLSVSRHPVGAVLGRALSSRILYPIGQLAYSAYLLNPIVTVVLNRQLLPLVWQGKATPMALFLPFDLVGTLLAAAIVYVLVERPFMELRPRLEGHAVAPATVALAAASDSSATGGSA
ncbi:O-antigen acetylase [Minicystis rosea]|nr:O-antigen acetylase [Minicystis rosea]